VEVKPSIRTDLELEDTFKNHVCHICSDTPLVSRFTFRQPETSQYWFSVLIAPTIITLYGDVGELILMRRGDPRASMIGWLADSINSPHYLLEKVPEEMKTSCLDFNEGGALDLLKEWEGDGEDSDLIEELRERVTSGEDPDGESWTIYSFIRHTYPLWEGCDPPSCEWFSQGWYYKIAALRCFLRHMKQKEGWVKPKIKGLLEIETYFDGTKVGAVLCSEHPEVRDFFGNKVKITLEKL
jgi:hypothetical protein